MDEAFMPFASIVERMMSFRGEFTAPEQGVRTYVTGVEIESPVELDVTRDANGALRIGSTPPLYLLRTSVAPSYHRVKFSATLTERADE